MPSAERHNLVISTRNPNKVREIQAILTDIPVKLITLADFPDAPEVIEDKETLDENASKKAQVLFAHTGIATMADDTGLEVMALHGAPGVHSARYAGTNPTQADNRAHLIEQLKGIDHRRAQFRTSIAFTTASGTYLFEGICKGRILSKERGDGGFGYDSLFVPDGFEDSFAEMNAEDKNAISHRGRALKRFASYLTGLLATNE